MNKSPESNELFTHIRTAAVQVYQELASPYPAIKTGFSALDQMIGGMRKDDLILIGGRPGMGKTAFALNIALSVAKNEKKKVCIFSWELAATQVASRIISCEAMVDSFLLRKERSEYLKSSDWDKLASATNELANCDILIDDTPNISVNEIRTKLGKIENPGLVVVNYLGMLTDNIARKLKLLAQEFHVPVICCTQLPRRKIQYQKSYRPNLSDLRFIKGGAQVADLIMLIYREPYYLFGDDARQDTAEVIVAKNRHGSTGIVKLGWDGRCAKFYDKTYE